MKKFLAILLSALMLMTLLAACGTSNEPSGENTRSSVEAPESETPAEPVELTVWHDNDEALMQAMADAANAKLEGTGVTLTFEKRTGLSDQLKLYGGEAEYGLGFGDTGGSWAEGYIISAAHRGIINGYEDGSFRPENTITRAEVAKIVNVLLPRTGSIQSSKTWNDVAPTAWYYNDVLQATTGQMRY